MSYSGRQYQQQAQSAIDLNPRKNRFLSSTGFSNPINPNNTMRLPQLARSSSSSKSTKLKLTTIEATLSAIEQDTHNLKQETRVSYQRYRNQGDTRTSSKTSWGNRNWEC
jgi:cell division septum initiation protein DivIVA